MPRPVRLVDFEVRSVGGLLVGYVGQRDSGIRVDIRPK